MRPPWLQLAGLGLAGNAIVINWIQYSSGVWTGHA